MAKKKDINIFQILYDQYQQLKRMNMGEIPQNILNTMDIIFVNDEIKPVLIKNGVRRYSGGWHFTFTLNPGCSFEKVKKKKDFFESVVKGTVDIERKGKFLHINVTDFKFERFYGFDLLTSKLYQAHKKKYLPIPIGVKPGGKILMVDMEKFSHLMIGGHNNSGKSAWIRQMMLFLAKYRPDIRQILIDFKRLDAKPMRKIAVVGTSIEEAHYILESLKQIVQYRLTLMEDCDDFIFKASELNLYPILVIIDELAEMEDKESQKMLVHLARYARATGVHLITSLQRPSHTTYKNFTDSRSQFPARLSFSMADGYDSETILGKGNYKAAKLNAKGRAIWSLDKKETEIQSIFVDAKDIGSILNQLDGSQYDYGFITPNDRLLP